ncbi:MAG TPA: cupin domain-containing protein [Methylomirabilota bacterium]|jgi:quercetin dioxygenase-like cupin family protein|nr:cupin domain-containing protein [Methylomirabilota bacterium]
MRLGRRGGHRRSRGRRALAAAFVLALALGGRLAAAQTGAIQEQVLVDNDEVRVALLVFSPGSASGEHVGLDPELGIVLEGELTLLTPAGREVLGPGSVRWLPALVPHDARNEGPLPLRLWVVVVKH